jgi:hypothetical protein
MNNTLAEQIKQVTRPDNYATSKVDYDDIIRQLTDIVKVQHEALLYANRNLAEFDGVDEITEHALALSAPIVTAVDVSTANATAPISENQKLGGVE